MDVWQAITEDHRAIDRLFRRLAGAADSDMAERGRFFERLRDLLERHGRAEEEAFYPELRQLVATRERVPDVLEDHARFLIALEDLASTPKGSETWAMRCADLDREVRRHVRYEEDVLIPAARERIAPREAETMLRRYDAAKGLA